MKTSIKMYILNLLVKTTTYKYKEIISGIWNKKTEEMKGILHKRSCLKTKKKKRNTSKQKKLMIIV